MSVARTVFTPLVYDDFDPSACMRSDDRITVNELFVPQSMTRCSTSAVWRGNHGILQSLILQVDWRIQLKPCLDQQLLPSYFQVPSQHVKEYFNSSYIARSTATCQPEKSSRMFSWIRSSLLIKAWPASDRDEQYVGMSFFVKSNSTWAPCSSCPCTFLPSS